MAGKDYVGEPRPADQGPLSGSPNNLSPDAMWRQLCRVQGDLEAMRRSQDKMLEMHRTVTQLLQEGNDLQKKMLGAVKDMVDVGDENTRILTENAELISHVFGRNATDEARAAAQEATKKRHPKWADDNKTDGESTNDGSEQDSE